VALSRDGIDTSLEVQNRGRADMSDGNGSDPDRQVVREPTLVV
jgi:hypothetical protein